MSKSTDPIKVVAKNRKATFDFHIGDRYEAGLVLLGSEVKSVRDGRVSLQEAFAKFSDDGELFLMNCHIAEYPWANRNNHEPLRPRKLLLSRKELGKLSQAITLAGATIVPLSMYLKNGLLKLEVGVGKGKKLYDKRDDLKKRSAQRDIDRGQE
ncbi:MAG: SsrA-binding protein [Deltaproteobacteria bacterium CG2_30_63_29]|nr:MAG: SsrA-binding protein [Deltaproteobacteria bacterium CG2_30_63_29]PJB41085.1 MAG: SsrA-binding protein [Deltaproteobacteria bacterium CG_4_9_14_3_um_filter_63_12]